MNSRGARTQRRAAERRAANDRRLELLAIQKSYRRKRKIENGGESRTEQ